MSSEYLDKIAEVAGEKLAGDYEKDTATIDINKRQLSSALALISTAIGAKNKDKLLFMGQLDFSERLDGLRNKISSSLQNHNEQDEKNFKWRRPITLSRSDMDILRSLVKNTSADLKVVGDDVRQDIFWITDKLRKTFGDPVGKEDR